MLNPFLRRRTYLPYGIEVIASVLARLLYRVRTSGTEYVPQEGGALLIANHLSYVDVVVLQLACPRRIRFVGFKGLRHHWFFDLCLRWSGTLLISARHPTEGVKRAVKSLRAGELVCVFPEGHISRTGQLMEIKRGFEIMARQAEVPVIPAAIDGLWGSIFSFAGQRYLWKSPRLKPTPVFVAFGPRLPAREVTTMMARAALLDLAAQAFEERPVLKRHLGREAVRSLARRPWHIEVVDRTAERRPVSAGKILAAAAVLSRHLRQTVPESRVGIVLPPGAGGFIANLAVCCAGKTPVNLNFTAGRAAVEAALRLGEISTVITADAMRAKVPAFPWPERTFDLRALIADAGGPGKRLLWLVAAWVLPNQWIGDLLKLPRIGDRAEAALLFTSGSVGEPKGVVLTHRNILANCAQVSSLSILPRDCTLLACLPLFHSFGFTVTLWYPMLRGCRVVSIPSPLDTRRMIDAIAQEKVTTVIAAPTFLRPWLKKATSAELISLDLVVAGAEKLPEDLARSFLERFHLEILQGYGLTETTPVTNVNQPDPQVVTRTGEPQIGKRHGSVGRLLPGMTARIVDPDTAEVLAATERGMVWLRGANVFPGYLNDETRTRAALANGWFVTGDLGRFDQAGFLYIEGRLSRFSKIGGEMVPHVTIEQKILEVFEWDQSERPTLAVMGIPDSAKGEAIVLITTEQVSAEEVRARLLEAGLPNLWVPKIVQRTSQIPMLGTGKLDLKGCRELAMNSQSGPLD